MAKSTTKGAAKAAPKAASKKKPVDPDLQAIMDRIAALPNLDALMAKHPRRITPADLKAIVAHQREKRTLFAYKAARKEANAEDKENE